MSSAVSIGGQIRRLRESAGLQAAQLAAALGVDPSAVSNIEHGKRSVKASELAVIADFLGVSQLAILEPDSLLARLPVAARADGASVEGSVMARLTAMAELHHVLADGGHPSRRIRSAPANENPEGWLDRANTSRAGRANASVASRSRMIRSRAWSRQSNASSASTCS